MVFNKKEYKNGLILSSLLLIFIGSFFLKQNKEKLKKNLQFKESLDISNIKIVLDNVSNGRYGGDRYKYIMLINNEEYFLNYQIATQKTVSSFLINDLQRSLLLKEKVSLSYVPFEDVKCIIEVKINNKIEWQLNNWTQCLPLTKRLNNE